MNCGAKNEEGTKFCMNCGTELEAAQSEVSEDIVGTQETGAESQAEYQQEEILVAMAEETQTVTEAEEQADAENYATEEEYIYQKSSILKKIIIAAVVVVAVIVACFAVTKVVSLSNDEVDYGKFPVIYVKDDEVMVRPDGKKESYEISEDNSDYKYGYYDTIQLTKNGDGIFYADDLSSYDEFDLYYRKTKDMDTNNKGEKIAKDVTRFEIVPDNKAVVYLRDEKLCNNDLKNEKVIDKNIVSFTVNEDGKKVIYEEDDGDRYICGFGKNDKPEKIDSDIDMFVTSLYSGDYKKLYYIKDNKLYCKENGKSKKKIASDVESAYEIDGKIFVLKSESKEYKYKDLIIDDISDDLDSLVDPDSIEEPDYFDYDDYDDYYDAYDAYLDEHSEAEEKWEMYDKIEEIKEYFDDNPFEINNYTLYSLNAGKLKKIDENLTSGELYVYDKYAFYTKADGEAEIKKVKLSEVSSEYDAENKIRENMEKSSKDEAVCLLSSNGKSFVAFTDDNILERDISEDGKYLYVLMAEEGEDGELVRYTITSSKLKDKKTLIDDVTSFTYYNNDLITATNEDDELILIEKGKDKVIAEDYAHTWYEDGYLFFLDDYSNNSGELVRYKNGKTKTIVNDVSDYIIYDVNKIAFIQDYDDDDGYGELYICNKNGKAKLIDDEVQSIIYPFY
jgi:hypothetical protein